MPDVYKDRLKAYNRLEYSEAALLQTAARIRAEELEKELEDGDVPANVRTEKNLDSERGLDLADQLVPRDQRPTHRLPFGFLPFGLPFVSKRVDTIDWAKGEIERTNTGLAEMQKVLAREVAFTTRSSRFLNMSSEEMIKELETQTYPPLNSAFILFNNQMAAHMASLLLTHHEPYHMAKKYIDVAPEDVIWDNLSMNPYEAHVRTLISYGFTAGLVSSSAYLPISYDLIHTSRLFSGHSRLHSSEVCLTSQSCAQPTNGFIGFAISLLSLVGSLVVSSLLFCSLSSWHFSPSSSVASHASRVFPSIRTLSLV